MRVWRGPASSRTRALVGALARLAPVWSSLHAPSYMTHLPNGHLRIFVATRADAVPADARPFISVDGAVPGATLTWDHHRSGELVNLEAMPPAIDARDLRGIGT